MSITIKQIDNELRRRIRINTVELYELVEETSGFKDIKGAMEEIVSMDTAELIKEDMYTAHVLLIVKELREKTEKDKYGLSEAARKEVLEYALKRSNEILSGKDEEKL